MSLGPASDSRSARKRKTAVGVSLRAAARDRNLVPRSADFFVPAAGGGLEDAGGAVASGMEAATSGFFAISAISAGGVDVDNTLSVAEAELRGSFCERFDAGEEGDSVAHAGSALEVEPSVGGGGCVDVEVDCRCERDCTLAVEDGAASVAHVVNLLDMLLRPVDKAASDSCENARSFDRDETPSGYKKGRMEALPTLLDGARRHDAEAATATVAMDREDML